MYLSTRGIKTKKTFPPGTPSLVGASRLIQREKGLKISQQEALQNLKDQILEMEKKQKEPEDPRRHKESIGDLLLTLTQLAEALEVYPEEALREKIKKILTNSP